MQAGHPQSQDQLGYPPSSNRGPPSTDPGFPRKPPAAMPVMTTTERQLSRQFLEFRDERVSSEQHIWAKLDELTNSVRDLYSRSEKDQWNKGMRQPAIANSAVDGAEVSSNLLEILRSQVTGLKDEVAVQHSAIEQFVTAERDIRRILEKFVPRLTQIEDSVARVSDQVVANLQRTVVSPDAAGTHQGNLDMAKPLQDIFHKLVEQDALINDCRAVVSTFEQQVTKQAADMSCTRSLLTEIQIQSPLHAVRASRIALRSMELSKEERQAALKSLESKEEAIRVDIDKARRKAIDPTPSV